MSKPSPASQIELGQVTLCRVRPPQWETPGHERAPYLFFTFLEKVNIPAFWIAMRHRLDKIVIDMFETHSFVLADLRTDGYEKLEIDLESGNSSYKRGVPGARQESAIDADGALIDGNCTTAAELNRQSARLELDGWYDVSCGGAFPEILIVNPSRLSYKGCVKIGVEELLDMTDEQRSELELRIVAAQ